MDEFAHQTETGGVVMVDRHGDQRRRDEKRHRPAGRPERHFRIVFALEFGQVDDWFVVGSIVGSAHGAILRLHKIRPPGCPDGQCWVQVPILLDQAGFTVEFFGARMQRDADALKRGFLGHRLALGVARIEQLAGAVVPQRLGDLVDQVFGLVGRWSAIAHPRRRCRRRERPGRRPPGSDPWRRRNIRQSSRRPQVRKSAPEPLRRSRQSSTRVPAG